MGRPLSCGADVRSRSWTAIGMAVAGLALVGSGAVGLARAPSATATALAPATHVLTGTVGAAPVPAVPHAAAPVPAGSPAARLPVPFPVHVAMPQQRAGGVVVPIGVLPAHDLDLPSDPRTVGWWSGGPPPGSPAGRAVLAGHVDSATQGLGTLAALLDVHRGDPVLVTDAAGTVRRYVVDSRTSYRKQALPSSLFAGDGPAGLVLITCGGPYDVRTHHYRDNVVVVALPAP